MTIPDGGSSLRVLITILAACSMRASCISSTFAEGVITATSPWRSMLKDRSWLVSLDMALVPVQKEHRVTWDCLFKLPCRGRVSRRKGHRELLIFVILVYYNATKAVIPGEGGDENGFFEIGGSIVAETGKGGQ